MPLTRVPDEGEWRIVQTARGNRKGPYTEKSSWLIYKLYPTFESLRRKVLPQNSTWWYVQGRSASAIVRLANEKGPGGKTRGGCTYRPNMYQMCGGPAPLSKQRLHTSATEATSTAFTLNHITPCMLLFLPSGKG